MLIAEKSSISEIDEKEIDPASLNHDSHRGGRPGQIDMFNRQRWNGCSKKPMYRDEHELFGFFIGR
jgi:hypothetical protein